jgi:hypothetical protein
VKVFYTKGVRNCISNYRPLSLMASFSNVFENRLPEKKFGFRKNPTTEKASYELINEIVRAVNGKLISHCTLDTSGFCAM